MERQEYVSNWAPITDGGGGEELQFVAERGRTFVLSRLNRDAGAYLEMKDNAQNSMSAYLSPADVDLLIVSLIEAKMKIEGDL